MEALGVYHSFNPHHTCTSLNTLQDRLLELPLHLLSLLVRAGLAVEVKQGAKVELRCLEELDFPDVNLAIVNTQHLYSESRS